LAVTATDGRFERTAQVAERGSVTERRASVSEKETWISHFLQKFGSQIVEVEHHVLGAVQCVPHFKHDHPPVRNVNERVLESFTPLERVALFITQHVGNFGFFLILLAWSVSWLLWNTLGPRNLRFDPAPAFVLWLFISNLIQITLMPLIMVGQNLLNRHAEYRSEEDFKINVKSEQETQAVLLHLEHQAAQIGRQGELIVEILQKLEKGAEAGQATRELILQMLQGLEKSAETGQATRALILEVLSRMEATSRGARPPADDGG
jgi:uncharacterized membrane protein